MSDDPDDDFSSPALRQFAKNLAVQLAGRRETLDDSRRGLDVDLARGLGAQVLDDPALRRRFVVRRRIGSGGMGIVYEAEDLERGMRVALKVMNEVSPGRLRKFKNEFRALAGIVHPNLVELYELLSVGDRCCFTMELIVGSTFLEYIRADRTRLRATVRQIMLGLGALHDRDKIHCDLKPSNVRITPEGRVAVLDFGLIADAASRDDVDAEWRFAGTPEYMSPEQAVGEAPTPRSDVYSAGVMLYEALASRLPHAGTREERHLLLRRKVLEDPLPPGAVAAGVPPELDELCMAMLRRDPAERLSVADVLRRVSADADAAVPEHRTLPGQPRRLLGRERPLAALEAAFAAALGGRLVVARVHGPAGIGKTTLVQHFLDGVREQERATVREGRCYERDNLRFKAFDSLIDTLSRYLEGLPREHAARLIPSQIAALTQIFPVLERIGAVAAAAPAAPAAAADPLELRRRAFAALRELLVGIARERPLVLFIDDLHWGDADSAALLASLLELDEPVPLLVIVTYRDGELPPAIAAALPEAPERAHDVPVGPLDPESACAVAVALLDPDADPAAPVDRGKADAIASESAGNPFFVHVLVRYLEDGAGSLGDQRAGGPATLEEFLAARLARLDREARRLLALVSIAGGPIPEAVVHEASGLGAAAPVALSALRAAHLVRLRGLPGQRRGQPSGQPWIEAFHDRVREVAVESLAPGEQRDCHLRLAHALEATGTDDLEALALHFRDGGDAERGRAYSIEAAEQSVRSLAFDRAATWFRAALELTPAEDASAAGLKASLAATLAHAGRSADAARAYLDAADAAPPAQQLTLREQAAEQFLIGGHVDEGMATIAQVLGSIGMRMASTPRRALLSLIWHRARLRLRGLYLRADAPPVPETEQLRMDACWAVGLGLSMIDNIRAADFQTRHLLMALAAGDRHRTARSLAMEVAFQSLGGRKSRARTLQLAGAAARLAREVGDPHPIALATLVSGIADYVVGNWRRAFEQCEEAAQLLRAYGRRLVWEQTSALRFANGSLVFLGEVRDLGQRIREQLAEALDRGNLYSATEMRTRFNIVWLIDDDAAEAQRQVEEAVRRWSRSAFHLQHYSAVMARTQLALYRGDAELAMERVREAWGPLTHATLMRRIQVLRIEMLHARARAALARVAGGGIGASAAEELLRGAEADARRIERERMAWAAPYATKVRAAVAMRRGDQATALRLLDRTIAALDAAGMALHAAAVRLRRGELVGGDEGRALRAAGLAFMTAQGIKNPARMTAMLAPGFETSE